MARTILDGLDVSREIQCRICHKRLAWAPEYYSEITCIDCAGDENNYRVCTKCKGGINDAT